MFIRRAMALTAVTDPRVHVPGQAAIAVSSSSSSSSTAAASPGLVSAPSPTVSLETTSSVTIQRHGIQSLTLYDSTGESCGIAWQSGSLPLSTVWQPIDFQTPLPAHMMNRRRRQRAPPAAESHPSVIANKPFVPSVVPSHETATSPTILEKKKKQRVNPTNANANDASKPRACEPVTDTLVLASALVAELQHRRRHRRSSSPGSRQPSSATGRLSSSPSPSSPVAGNAIPKHDDPDANPRPSVSKPRPHEQKKTRTTADRLDNFDKLTTTTTRRVPLHLSDHKASATVIKDAKTESGVALHSTTSKQTTTTTRPTTVVRRTLMDADSSFMPAAADNGVPHIPQTRARSSSTTSVVRRLPILTKGTTRHAPTTSSELPAFLLGMPSFTRSSAACTATSSSPILGSPSTVDRLRTSHRVDGSVFDFPAAGD